MPSVGAPPNTTAPLFAATSSQDESLRMPNRAPNHQVKPPSLATQQPAVRFDASIPGPECARPLHHLRLRRLNDQAIEPYPGVRPMTEREMTGLVPKRNWESGEGLACRCAARASADVSQASGCGILHCGDAAGVEVSHGGTACRDTKHAGPTAKS